MVMNSKLREVDFSKKAAAQDMLAIIMKKKGLSAQAALLSCISNENYHSIITSGWANMAYSHWGHADLDRDWLELENPVFYVSMSEEQEKNLFAVCYAENVRIDMALCFFLVFEMQKIGYHI